jgi:hypothetical protein
MKQKQTDKAGEKRPELTQLERVSEALLIFLTGGMLIFIYLWIVLLA